jgi:hypothetical protein
MAWLAEAGPVLARPAKDVWGSVTQTASGSSPANLTVLQNKS